ncbi:MAG: hypothetical protein HYX75_24880 [Acidobacteria bacterium]|nr:hypothetical protein [Acidobacteriota bacterium]
MGGIDGRGLTVLLVAWVFMAQAVTAADQDSSARTTVTSLNNLRGKLTITSGPNVTVVANPSSRTITIDAPGGSLSTGGWVFTAQNTNTGSGGIGVYASTDSSGNAAGVWGYSGSAASYGVYGQSSQGVGIGGYSASGEAGQFVGNVSVTGTLSKGAGSFKIDHPLDPENKYLYHSFVESPDMMNIYNGNAILDGEGEAVVNLPDWFDALNEDFRYQLTSIGSPAPNLHVGEKLAGNRFRIAGGSPGGEVSWQITGIRHDVYAQAHRIPVEVEKADEDRGRYLHPELYGQDSEMAVDTARVPIRPGSDVGRPQER